MDGEADRAFARVTMSGERFADGRLPVETLAELARYRTLVVRAAEAEWRKDNPGNEIPEDFSDGFELALIDVQSGSAVSVLDRTSSSVYDSYYDFGRDEIENEISRALSPDVELDEIPLLQYPEFSQLGSSLRSGEVLLFPSERASGADVAITKNDQMGILIPLAERFQETLNHAVRPTRRTETRWIVGRLTKIDADKKNYTIRSDTFGRVNGRYSEREVFDDLRAVLGSSDEAPVVRLFADLRFAGDDLDRILDVYHVQVLAIDGEPWSRRFLELAELEPGWNDEAPESAPVSFHALDGAREVLNHVKKEGLRMPGLFPVDDGGVNVEWASPAHVVSIEIDPDANFEVFSMDQSGNSSEFTTGDISKVKEFISGAKL